MESNSIRLFFDPGQVPQRLDRFLAEHLPDLTRSQLKKLIENHHVTVDGEPCRPAGRLKGGETLVVILPEAVPTETPAEDIPLDILYEDRHLIVVNKPAGLVVHPAAGHYGGTLVNALLFHCHDLSGIGGELRPGIVHRLDKDTSGVLVAAKDDKTHQHLALQFKEHTISRRYQALVHGVVQPATGVVDSPIGRHPVHRKKMSSAARSGKRSVTHWTVLRRYTQDRLTLVELALETGRTHQIRVHFSEMNLPIVGDPLYSKPGRINALADETLRRLAQKLGRQALHARLLGFVHPATGEYVEFVSPLPADMGTIVDYLDKKYEPGDRPSVETEQL